jgi:hypothetical protein
MFERSKASAAPRIDERASLKPGEAPGGPLGGSSVQPATPQKAAHPFSLEFLVSLIAKPSPDNPSQERP